jgi:hypothetical protein
MLAEVARLRRRDVTSDQVDVEGVLFRSPPRLDVLWG